MSVETHAQLEAAIEAHIANECDGDITGAWVILAETTTLTELDTDESSYYIGTRENQSVFMTDGLLHTALQRNA